MPEKTREIEIETLETPKGSVPTVKGLETAINSVYKELTSLDKHLLNINENLTKLGTQINEQTQKMSIIGESLTNLVVYLNKFDTKQSKKNEISVQQMIINKSDLIALKEDLSRILEQLENRVVKNNV